MREQKYSHWRKQLTDIQGERKRKVPSSVLMKETIYIIIADAEFKEFEPRLKFKPRLKYGWFPLKSYSLFHQDLSQGSNETCFWRI